MEYRPPRTVIRTPSSPGRGGKPRRPMAAALSPFGWTPGSLHKDAYGCPLRRSARKASPHRPRAASLDLALARSHRPVLSGRSPDGRRPGRVGAGTASRAAFVTRCRRRSGAGGPGPPDGRGFSLLRYCVPFCGNPSLSWLAAELTWWRSSETQTPIPY